MTDHNPDGVLTPDELEPNGKRVRELDDGRRVVHTDGGEGLSPDGDPGSRPPDNHRVHERDGQPGAETAPGVYADVADLAGAHALAAAARTDDAEDTVVTDTDDVSEAFERLVCWYATLVAEDRRPETVLAVLFEHTDLDLEVRQQ